MTDEHAPGHGPYAYPVVAALSGCAVLVIAALAVPRLIAQQPYATLLTGFVVLGVLLWAIGFVVTIRHASALWKLATLAVLAAAGAVAGLVAHAQYQTRARADASSFAEIEFGPQGAPQLPSGIESRGPISRLFAASVQADAQDQRAFANALGSFGAGNLNSPYLLERDPRAIGNCGALKQIEADATAQAGKRSARHAALDRAVRNADLPEQAKTGITAMAGPPEQGGDAVLANQRAMLRATGELCTLLARRGWSNQGGYFGFRSGVDKARFDALAAERLKIAGETARIERAAAERMRQGREQVRDALSRSIYAS